jgi:carboxymethylenebutenolidase
MSGKDVTFDAKGQPAAGYLSLPQQQNASGVLVLHAWWGLNPIFKQLCDRLAAEGFAAFAPDVNSGRVAKTIDEAKQVMSELDGQRKYDVVTSAPDFLRDQPGVRNEPFAVIGFSMGAAWSLVLAEERPQDIQKIVMFYGAGEADYPKLKADVIGHFAEKDEWEDEKYIRAMQEGMEAAGLKVKFDFYPNTSHWFFENDRPEFNAEAADLAWKRTLEFLRK